MTTTNVIARCRQQLLHTCVLSNMFRVASSVAGRHSLLLRQQGVIVTSIVFTNHLVAGAHMQSRDTCAQTQPEPRQQPQPTPVIANPRAKAVLDYWCELHALSSARMHLQHVCDTSRQQYVVHLDATGLEMSSRQLPTATCQGRGFSSFGTKAVPMLMPKSSKYVPAGLFQSSASIRLDPSMLTCFAQEPMCSINFQSQYTLALQRFGDDVSDLEDGKLREWDQPYERLAAILLADQFTRSTLCMLACCCRHTETLQPMLRDLMWDPSLSIGTCFGVQRRCTHWIT
jgi:hypothetical protein